MKKILIILVNVQEPMDGQLEKKKEMIKIWIVKNGKLEIFWLTKYLKYDFVKAHYFYKKFSDSFKG